MVNMDDQFDLIDQADALESFRASDFDCYSAYGEVLDNSVQANASIVKVTFKDREDRSRRNKMIGEVFFADNGEGMTPDILRRCLKLGYSSRKNDRKGIGRFGVGMTSGAINQCRRVEVYSKVEGGGWYYVYLDLDEVKESKQKVFPIPEKINPPEDVSDFIKNHGTVVRWLKYDNQEFPYHVVVKQAPIYFGRTYRRFIWGTAKGYEAVSLYVNGKEVNAIDPLYVNKSKTGFEGEDAAELFPPTYHEEMIPNDHDSKKQKSTIEINMSLLPDSYRQGRLQGNSPFAKERYIDRNEGISIMRNDREVFYGRVPYWGGNWADPVSRYIGVEISFNAELDKLFKVKNIKRGALPYGDLNLTLKDLMQPTLRSQLDVIKQRWNEIELEKEKENQSSNIVTNISPSHNKTNTILKEHKDDLLTGDKNKQEKNNNVIATQAKPSIHGNEKEIQEVIESLKENGITIDEKPFVGTTFLNIVHGNGLKAMTYNTNSTFFKAYEEILNELKTRDNELAENYRVLIDLIFVGYMLAESKIEPESQYEGEEFIEDIKSNWSKELSKILKKWQS